MQTGQHTNEPYKYNKICAKFNLLHKLYVSFAFCYDFVMSLLHYVFIFFVLSYLHFVADPPQSWKSKECCTGTFSNVQMLLCQHLDFSMYNTQRLLTLYYSVVNIFLRKSFKSKKYPSIIAYIWFSILFISIWLSLCRAGFIKIRIAGA